MDRAKLSAQVKEVVDTYDPALPHNTADALRGIWLQYEPNKGIEGIKAERRAQQETVGIPIPVLREIGKGFNRYAKNHVDEMIPLVQALWDDYGREGRVVALIPLGKMELAAPEKIVPMIYEMCKTCLTWEDADRLAMNALEPVLRKDPGNWLEPIAGWLEDGNFWVRRAGVTAIGRLPMKHPDLTPRCVELAAQLINDETEEVRTAVSFALRISARGDTLPVRDFLAANVPPENPAATWTVCDVIRSMGAKLLPDFAPLLANYESWLNDPELSSKHRRSVASAVKKLQKVQ